MANPRIDEHKRKIKVVKVKKSILEYFRMINNLDNESKETAEVTEKEFKDELTRALNCSSAPAEIIWID